jgi:hypothetical protein
MPRVKDDDLPPGFYRKRGIVYVAIFDPALGRRVDTSTGVKDAEAAIIRARELERIAADPRAWNAERTTLSQAIETKRVEMAELVIAKKMKQVTLDYYLEKATRLVRYIEHERDQSGRPLSCACQTGVCPAYRPAEARRSAAASRRRPCRRVHQLSPVIRRRVQHQQGARLLAPGAAAGEAARPLRRRPRRGLARVLLSGVQALWSAG